LAFIGIVSIVFIQQNDKRSFDCGSLRNLLSLIKKVKYAYQEMPRSEDTASRHSQEEERERERESIVHKMTISKQTPQTINKMRT
jgi:hypothetical protein